MRPLLRSYAEISTVTVSPGRMRMKFLPSCPKCANNLVTVVQSHLELRVGQGRDHLALHFQTGFFFRHAISSLQWEAKTRAAEKGGTTAYDRLQQLGIAGEVGPRPHAPSLPKLQGATHVPTHRARPDPGHPSFAGRGTALPQAGGEKPDADKVRQQVRKLIQQLDDDSSDKQRKQRAGWRRSAIRPCRSFRKPPKKEPARKCVCGRGP